MPCSLYCSIVYMYMYGRSSYSLLFSVHCIVQGCGYICIGGEATLCYALFITLFNCIDVYVWEERLLSVMPCSLHCSMTYMYMYGTRGYSLLCPVHYIVQWYRCIIMGGAATLCYSLFIALFKDVGIYVLEERLLSVIPCSLHCSRVWMYKYGRSSHSLLCPVHCIVQWHRCICIGGDATLCYALFIALFNGIDVFEWE